MDFNLGSLELKGKKHYEFGNTPVMEYKPGLKVGFPKNVTCPEIQFTYQSEGGPKKLTYMPPIKKTKEFISKGIKISVNKEVFFINIYFSMKKNKWKIREWLNSWINGNKR